MWMRTRAYVEQKDHKSGILYVVHKHTLQLVLSESF